MKIKNNFITIEEFCIRHGVASTSIHQLKNIPDSVKSKSVVPMRINESYFIMRDDFVRKVKEESLDNFYELSELIKGRYRYSSSGSAIGRLLIALGAKTRITVFNSFISGRVYENKKTSVICNNIGTTQWEFWRMSRWLIKIVKHIDMYDEQIILQYINDRKKDNYVQ